MAQYDVHRRLNVAPDDPIPYLLVLQADHVDRLGTLLVAPMERTSEPPARIVQVTVYFNAERLLVLINEMGAIRRTALGGKPDRSPRMNTTSSARWISFYSAVEAKRF